MVYDNDMVLSFDYVDDVSLLLPDHNVADYHGSYAY
jgi:hypothetical protein